MKLRLNKLMAGVALACGALTLVACGDGGTPDLLVTANFQANIDGDTLNGIDVPKAIIEGANSIDFAIPNGLTFPRDTASTDAEAPAGSTLTLKTTTSAEPKAIADFTIVAPNNAGEATGTVLAGSCVFKVGSATGVFAPPKFEVGKSYTFDPCSLTLPTLGLSVDSSQEVKPLLDLTNPTTKQKLGLTGKAITITISSNNGSNTATIKVGTKTIGNVQLPTGATGGTGSITVTGQ